MKDRSFMEKENLNIELVLDSTDFKLLRTTCSCLSEDHTMWIEIEYDKEYQNISLGFYYKIIPTDLIFNLYDGIFRRLCKRIKFIFKATFNRPIQFEEGFLFRGKDHINQFCDAIKQLTKETYT